MRRCSLCAACRLWLYASCFPSGIHLHPEDPNDSFAKPQITEHAPNPTNPPPGLGVPQMRVDTSRREELHVSFNVTFPALPCEALLMDAGDVSGKWQTESRMKVAK